MTTTQQPPKPPPPAEAEIYTLRIWRRADGFRAAVRAVGEEDSRYFTEPLRLAEFLLALPNGEPRS